MQHHNNEIFFFFLVLFPVPFFAIPNVLHAFWTTAKLCIDVLVAAFIGAPRGCSGGVRASQDPSVYHRAFIHSKAHLLFSCSVTLLCGLVPHPLLILTVISCILAPSQNISEHAGEGTPLLDSHHHKKWPFVSDLCFLSFLWCFSTWEGASLSVQLKVFESLW